MFDFTIDRFVRHWGVEDIQAEEVQDKLKLYYTKLPQLVLHSKADNTRKNYMYNFKQFSVWCNKC